MSTMWTSLCAILFIQLSLTIALPIQQPFEDILIPFENATIEFQTKCSTVQCPKLRCPKTVLEEGECCTSCDTTDNPLGCLADGELYEELSMIPSNSSDPCEVCHCCIGEVVCSSIFQTCPQLKCLNQVVVEEGKCCPRCADESNVNPEPATCVQNGITYQDGDVWNPYFPKFGVLKCQTCTCKNGSIVYETMSCPPVRQCTDDDPVEETIVCCPKCNRTFTNVTRSTNGSNDTYTPPILQPTMLTSKPCLVVTHAYRVYKTINERIDQIAIESINIANVDVYVWSNDTRIAQYESYSSEIFAETYIDVRFKYIGNTNKELVQTVSDWFNTKEENHSLFYCKYLCSARVIMLLQPSNSNDSNDNC